MALVFDEVWDLAPAVCRGARSCSRRVKAAFKSDNTAELNTGRRRRRGRLSTHNRITQKDNELLYLANMLNPPRTGIFGALAEIYFLQRKPHTVNAVIKCADPGTVIPVSARSRAP